MQVRLLDNGTIISPPQAFFDLSKGLAKAVTRAEQQQPQIVDLPAMSREELQMILDHLPGPGGAAPQVPPKDAPALARLACACGISALRTACDTVLASAYSPCLTPTPSSSHAQQHSGPVLELALFAKTFHLRTLEVRAKGKFAYRLLAYSMPVRCSPVLYCCIKRTASNAKRSFCFIVLTVCAACRKPASRSSAAQTGWKLTRGSC